MPDLEIHYADEWAALYVDGKLDRVGDSYLAEERAFELLGVKVVQDDAFLQGQDQAAGVAKTLDELYVYTDDRDRRKAHAERLRTEAANLLTQADQLAGNR